MECSQLIGSFQNFFQLFVNKVIGNLNFGDKTLAKYSIYVLKNIVSKISKDLKKKAKDNFLLNNISVKLFYINTSMLGDPKFYKLRYRSLGRSYLRPFLLDTWTIDQMIILRIPIQYLRKSWRPIGQTGLKTRIWRRFWSISLVSSEGSVRQRS